MAKMDISEGYPQIKITLRYVIALFLILAGIVLRKLQIGPDKLDTALIIVGALALTTYAVMSFLLIPKKEKALRDECRAYRIAFIAFFLACFGLLLADSVDRIAFDIYLLVGWAMIIPVLAYIAAYNYFRR